MPEEQVHSQSDDPVISIGVLAQKVGLSVSAVRRYENEGLIIAHRTVSGHRLFSHDDIKRVQNIQRLIQDSGLNLEGIRRMQSLLPCWDLFPCDAQTRRNCPAYHGGSRPCWMIKAGVCSAGENECRQCVVYRLGSLCTEQIKCLVYGQPVVGEPSEAFSELMDRKRQCQKEA